MNELFTQLGIAAWKPLVTALLLPPLPLIVWMLLGVGLVARRRTLGGAVVLSGAALVWASACTGVAEELAPLLLRLPPALGEAQIAALRTEARGPVGIVVLGGGVENPAPEYGASSLRYPSLERLRYGIWLSRRTGWPVGFSGGIGWGQPTAGGSNAAEASVAERIAAQEFGRPLKWVEDRSRDTRENARFTVALLRPAGVRHVLLVTHVWHMPRALRDFRRAAGDAIVIDAAPVGLARANELPILRWLPSGEGLLATRQVLREWLGGVAGA